jgi:hypothetical protein
MPSNRLNNSSSSGELAGELPVSERLNASGGKAGNLEKQEDSLNTDLRDYLGSMFDGLLFLSEPEFDQAIVGVADRIGMSTVVVYDTSKIIDILCERDGMDREEATEFYEFNILGAYVGEQTPMFISLIDDLVL